MEKFVFKLIAKEEIQEIKSLWQELNEHHSRKTQYFTDHYQKFTFENRMAGLLHDDTIILHIDVAVDAEHGKSIGYCLSSVNGRNEGEIESLYIQEGYRGQKIGDAFMKRALQWMDDKKVQSKKITVAEGNENAFDFYRKYGFYPRLTTLVCTQ